MLTAGHLRFLDYSGRRVAGHIAFLTWQKAIASASGLTDSLALNPSPAPSEACARRLRRVSPPGTAQ